MLSRGCQIGSVRGLAARHFFFVAAAAAATLGCGDRPPTTLEVTAAPGRSSGESLLASGGLRIATPWSLAERRAVEAQFRAWQRQRGHDDRTAIWIRWLDLCHDIPLDRALGGGGSADMVLGGSVVAYARLAQAGQFTPVGKLSIAPWLLLPRGFVSLAGRRPNHAEAESRIALGDPRVDHQSLAWMAGILEASWNEGYPLLLRTAARNPPQAGWRGRFAEAAVDRGFADLAPIAIIAATPNVPAGTTTQAGDAERRDGRGPAGFSTTAAASPDALVRSIPWSEGAAVLANGSNKEEAATVLEFLEAQRGARPADPNELRFFLTQDLLAEFLGATLVDAQDELRSAWRALEPRQSELLGTPAFRWFSEPPPWPPASVLRMLSKDGEEGVQLVHELARQLVPDPGLRQGLLRNWLGAPRAVDLDVLAELCVLEEGRLVREPRFRTWLRVEWAAWARQRYRRVRRLAESTSSAHPGRHEDGT